MTRTRVIHEVFVNIPPEYYAAYPNLDNLVILKEELFYDHRSKSRPSSTRLYQETIRGIEEYPYERLRRGVDLKDGPLMLEYCLRGLVQCEFSLSAESVRGTLVEMLESLTGMQSMMRSGTVPHINRSTPLLRRRALAACAWASFEAHFRLPTGGSMHAIETNVLMHDAASAANLCARDDWHPRIVIRIANWIDSLQYRYPNLQNKTSRSQAMRQLGEMRHLWDAYLAYRQTCIKAQIKEWYKVHYAENVYICAAKDCDVQAMHKSAFRACSGSCPPETKPHYCSKLCQQKHWFVHRYVCKKGIPKNPVHKDDGNPDWVDVGEYYDTNYSPDAMLSTSQIWSEQPGADICIDVRHPSPYRPLDMFRLRTTTLSPAFLRYFRWHWELRNNRLYSDDITSINGQKKVSTRKRIATKSRRAARVGQTKARFARRVTRS